MYCMALKFLNPLRYFNPRRHKPKKLRGGGGGQIGPPRLFWLFKNFFGTTVTVSSLFVRHLLILITVSDLMIDDIILISHATCVLTTKMQFFSKKQLFLSKY